MTAWGDGGRTQEPLRAEQYASSLPNSPFGDGGQPGDTPLAEGYASVPIASAYGDGGQPDDVPFADDYASGATTSVLGDGARMTEWLGTSEDPDSPTVHLPGLTRLTGFGSIQYGDPSPPTQLRGESALTIGEPVVGRMGGSMASVAVVAEGLGTKVLAGSTARVAVLVLGQGVRIAPYLVHPNTHEDPGYLPAELAALAVNRLNTPQGDTEVPRPTLTRQTWASDVPISRPAPAPSEPMVDLGGFAFGPTGIMLPVVEEDVEAMTVPTHEG